MFYFARGDHLLRILSLRILWKFSKAASLFYEISFTICLLFCYHIYSLITDYHSCVLNFFSFFSHQDTKKGRFTKVAFFLVNLSALCGFVCQTSFLFFHDFQILKIRPPVYHHTAVSSPPYIDSALFSDYLNRQFQEDSLPEPYKSGKPFSISVFYMVSKEGKISEVRLFRNPEDQDDLFEFVLAKLLACPYQWSPAYQNGRAVNGVLKMRIVGDQNNVEGSRWR